VGHQAAAACHLGVISMRLGRNLQWDPEREKFSGEGAGEASKLLAREMRKPFNYHFA
jgi:hypothetical protein